MANILHYLFICDQKKCVNGSCQRVQKEFIDEEGHVKCLHTSDIEHAKNYSAIPNVDELNEHFERQTIRRGNDKHIYYFEKGD